MERIEASLSQLGRPVALPAVLPDPVLTANVYCAGRLDDLLLRALADFWQRVRGEDPAPACKIWFVRYRRGGEHLKVRVHGPAEMAPFLREELRQAVERYFASLPPLTEGEAAAKARPRRPSARSTPRTGRPRIIRTAACSSPPGSAASPRSAAARSSTTISTSAT